MGHRAVVFAAQAEAFEHVGHEWVDAILHLWGLPAGARNVATAFTRHRAVHGLTDLLAQFHSELVKRVEVPEDAFNRSAVLIEGEQCTERLRIKSAHADGVAGAVTGHDEMRRETLDVCRGGTSRGELGFRLLKRSSLHERLRLRDAIRHQPRVL